LFIVGVAVWGFAGSGGGAAADSGPVHVHGLGINPADGALFIATHSGLYRVGEGEQSAERVGELLQDTMGFTIVGPDRFLGSGHPDIREARDKGLPPHLGLIESTDAGESWDAVSLLGEADFHVLRHAGERIYGYDSSNDRLIVSSDQGRSWGTLEKPGPIVDLAVAPGEPKRIVIASAGGAEEGLFESRDGGRRWTRIGEAVGLLTWPASDQLYLLTGDGGVLVSADGGRRFESRGMIGGEPAALVASEPRQLYVALHDGTIKTSSDGGTTWRVRSTP
jgi:photosystem II stability/assembly factor-like uncharacterized protein